MFPPISISPMHISVSSNETSMRIFPQFATRFTTEERRIGGLHWYIYDSQCKRYIPWEDKDIFVPKFTLPTYRYWWRRNGGEGNVNRGQLARCYNTEFPVQRALFITNQTIHLQSIPSTSIFWNAIDSREIIQPLLVSSKL